MLELGLEELEVDGQARAGRPQDPAGLGAVFVRIVLAADAEGLVRVHAGLGAAAGPGGVCER